VSNFPKRLVALARGLSEGDPAYGRLAEDPWHLDSQGVVDETGWITWRHVAEEAHAIGLAVVFTDEYDEPVEGDKISRSTRVKVRVRKPNTDSAFHAFTQQGVLSILGDEGAGSRARRILVAENVAAFRTESCEFDVWGEGSSEIVDIDPLEGIEPRRLVYDSTTRSVPRRVGHLLIKGALPAGSATFETWKSVVLRKLPLTLVNEVRSAEGDLTLVVKGARTQGISFRPVAGDATLFDIETTVARWIFAEGSGVENRHTFFTTELARIWPEGAEWSEAFARIGPQALEGAKSANNLMLSGKTGEVLRALGDLRKTMNDEVARVAQQCRDLGSSLWRDFVIAVTALFVRAASAANGTVVTIGARLLLGLAAVFLVYSLIVSVVGNRGSLRIANDSRKAWIDRVYPFISTPDIEALVTKPLADSEELYDRTEKMIVAAYVVLIIVVFATAVWQHPWSNQIKDLFRIGSVPTVVAKASPHKAPAKKGPVTKKTTNRPAAPLRIASPSPKPSP
jgi:hypothetical protein